MSLLLRALQVSAVLSIMLASTVPGQETKKPPATDMWNVAVLIYPKVELLDFAGPGEVFAQAHTLCNTYTVGESRVPMITMGLVELIPTYTLSDCPKPDLIVIPGGSIPSSNPVLQRWVREHVEQGGIVMSVCNGAHLLARSGLLRDLDVTTHRTAMAGIGIYEPTATVLKNRRFVDNGNVITTAGISAGIDGALHIVARLGGEKLAKGIAYHMEYDWRTEEIARLHAEPGISHESVDEELVRNLRKGGVETTLAALKSQGQLPSAGTLNTLGYGLMSMERMEEALLVLRLQAAAYPKSANAWDSLSEVSEEAGLLEESLESVEKAMALLAADETLSGQLRERVEKSLQQRLLRLSGDNLRLAYSCPPCGCPKDDELLDEGGACPDCGSQLVQKSVKVTAAPKKKPDVSEVSEATTYRCPPCGSACDEVEYSAPGSCQDGCGMVLQAVAMTK